MVVVFIWSANLDYFELCSFKTLDLGTGCAAGSKPIDKISGKHKKFQAKEIYEDHTFIEQFYNFYVILKLKWSIDYDS